MYCSSGSLISVKFLEEMGFKKRKHPYDTFATNPVITQYHSTVSADHDHQEDA
jgi:hypothetical protein